MTGAPLGSGSSVCALVPHHRCELWLAQALESLLEQTRPLDAIVVVDDGSEEPPVELVRGYPEVTLLAAEDNGGPYRAIQAAIDRTGFDAYLFQDADDWSAPERLEALLEEAARSGAELVGSHEVRVLVEEGDVVPVRYPLDVNAVLRQRPTAFPLLHPTSLVARALVCRLGGFATGMRFSGDAEFLRRAAHSARVVNADHFGYFRRKRPGSLTLDSPTALGSPARQAVQEILCERALANAERVAGGRAADLAPWRTASPPQLRHLAGPRPEALAPQRRRPPAAPQHVGKGPVFVLGAPGCGERVLAWALSQHPCLGLLHDSRWLARISADVEGRAGEEAAPPPPRFRPVIAAALAALAATSGGRRVVAAGSDLVPAAHALASLFPDARFVHVVRDVDDAAAALQRSPVSGGTYYTGEAAWRTWVAAAETGLALEEALGGKTVLRVRYEDLVEQPDETLRRCLAFIGQRPHPACSWPLAGLSPVGSLEPVPPPDALASRARQLSALLARPQPPLGPNPEVRRHLAERFRRGWSTDRAGGSLVERVVALVTASVPEGATVAVVSRGDPRLVDLGGRRAWHLPQVDDGTYAGYHPADSNDAIEQVERLRTQGADYLAIPAPGLWWLTYYEGLRCHLEDRAAVVAFQVEVGAVFDLAPAPAPALDGAPAPPRFVPVPPSNRRPVGSTP